MSEKSLSLYQIETDLQAFVDSEALVPEEQLALFQAEFAAKTREAVVKRTKCIMAIQHLEGQIAHARSEENRIAAWRGSLESGLARFKDYLVRCIELSGQKKVEADNGSLAIQANPESVEITDATLIPDEFVTVTVKMPATVYRQLLEVALVDDLPRNTLLDATFNPSKSAIKEAIKAGREVTGADVRFGRNRLVVR
jgi:hypothetical protein